MAVVQIQLETKVAEKIFSKLLPTFNLDQTKCPICKSSLFYIDYRDANGGKPGTQKILGAEVKFACGLTINYDYTSNVWKSIEQCQNASAEFIKLLAENIADSKVAEESKRFKNV